MSEEALEKLTRLMAVELLLTEMLATRYSADPNPVAAANVHRESWRQCLAQVSLPFIKDAGLSELAVGGVGDAIDRLIEIAGEMAVRRLG